MLSFGSPKDLCECKCDRWPLSWPASQPDQTALEVHGVALHATWMAKRPRSGVLGRSDGNVMKVQGAPERFRHQGAGGEESGPPKGAVSTGCNTTM